jgi:hypothetical protein
MLSRICAAKFPKIFPELVLVEMNLQLCERAVRSRVTLRKEGQVELLGRRLNNLARADLAAPREAVSIEILRNSESWYRIFIDKTD